MIEAIRKLENEKIGKLSVFEFRDFQIFKFFNSPQVTHV
jgi:hypothetical protein